MMDGIGNAFVGRLRSVVEKIVNGLKPIRYLVNWSRLYSLWPVHLTTACCSVEFGAASCPRFDVERMGMLPIGSLRQCDLLIIEGTITKKMGKRVQKIYSQMASPRYVVAMGACALSGGLFYNSYNIIKSVDEILPVDVYVPGCPPRPEALAHGIMMLQDKIRKKRINITKGE
jgi:NADH-quinone oxidoreductase subunit B